MSLLSSIGDYLTSEKKASPVEDSTGTTDSGLITAGGLLSKAIDTAGDIWAIKEANGKSAAVGSTYPTGQVNPAVAASKAATATGSTTTQVIADASNKKMLCIAGGVGALVLVIGLIVILKKK